MTRQELITAAKTSAAVFGIAPELLCAVIEQESDWDPWAVRYEPGFYERYISHMKAISDTEKTLRACSFGLTQIMGQVAREQGFSDTYLTGLFEPGANLYNGCQKLKRCLDRASDVRGALLLYNGGGSSMYPGEVLRRMPKYQGGQP